MKKILALAAALGIGLATLAHASTAPAAGPVATSTGKTTRKIRKIHHHHKKVVIKGTNTAAQGTPNP